MSGTVNKAGRAQPPMFDTLPPEIRLQIWEDVYSHLYYFAGGFHFGCEHPTIPNMTYKGWFRRFGAGYEEKTCRCGEGQFGPLLVCKAFYTELKPLFDKAPIVVEMVEGFDLWQLSDRYSSRIDKVSVLYKTYPVPMEGSFTLRFDVTKYPNLKTVVQRTPDRNSPLWAGSITFPRGIAEHITYSLSQPDGPRSVPSNDLWQRIRKEIRKTSTNRQTAFHLRTNGVQLKAKYRYKLTIQENFGWPFPFEYKTVMERNCESDLIWDKDGPRILDIPDLRGEWWWDDFFAHKLAAHGEDIFGLTWDGYPGYGQSTNVRFGRFTAILCPEFRPRV